MRQLYNLHGEKDNISPVRPFTLLYTLFREGGLRMMNWNKRKCVVEQVFLMHTQLLKKGRLTYCTHASKLFQGYGTVGRS